jgi:hypothetical protein
MNFVKWLRKNNTKIMAIVVVALMFLFIGGEYLQQLGQRRSRRQTIAYFLDNKKITNYDLTLAQQELEILKLLRADDLLRAQDLRGVFLGELLFSERRALPALMSQIKQSIRANGYRISDKQISDIYKRSWPGNLYWILLTEEAQQVGIKVANEEVGNLLGYAIPQLFNGQTYSQRVAELVNRHRISEKSLLTTFAKLLAVMQYAQLISANENVTTSQITHIASWENETIDVEFVKFDSEVFAGDQNQPGEEKSLEHFNTFKKFFPGTITDENPYGFGYNLSDRVQLEYLALKLDDVSRTVTPPSQEEIEEYYQKNRDQLFSEQVPADPNDPNSTLVKRTKSYAEVANIISKQLLHSKINSKAEKILQEARTITEANWKDTDAESVTLTAEQLKQMAGGYNSAATQLTEKYKIKIYIGQTGILSAADMQTDVHLSTLYLQGYGYNPIRLTQMVFAVDQLAASELTPYDMPKPKLYENIGPASDLLGQIMAVVRVIKAEKASEPESINQTFSIKTFDLEPNQADPNSTKERPKEIFSVKEKVTEDLKRLSAMNETYGKAEEFVSLATKEGWDIALNKFNELHRQYAKQNEAEPNIFELQSLTDLRRISSSALQALAAQTTGSPLANLLTTEQKKQARFINQLYSLIPPDTNTPSNLPKVWEFKPDMSFYCLKSLSVNRLYQQDFDKTKARQLFIEDQAQAQSLAVVHFNPENICKRLNFRPVTKPREPADTNEPPESQGPS